MDKEAVANGKRQGVRLKCTSEESAKSATMFRVHSWINTDTFDPLYGIEARLAPRQWCHVVVDGKPLLFKTEDQAHARIASLHTGALSASPLSQGGQE